MLVSHLRSSSLQLSCNYNRWTYAKTSATAWYRSAGISRPTGTASYKAFASGDSLLGERHDSWLFPGSGPPNNPLPWPPPMGAAILAASYLSASKMGGVGNHHIGCRHCLHHPAVGHLPLAGRMAERIRGSPSVSLELVLDILDAHL